MAAGAQTIGRKKIVLYIERPFRVFYKILTTGVDYNGTKMLGDIRRTDEDRLALTA